MLLANTPAQAEYLLHIMEQITGGIGLYVNMDEIEFIYFNQDDGILVDVKSLKLEDQFIYIGSNISSTESDRSDCNLKNKTVALSVLLYGHTTWRKS